MKLKGISEKDKNNTGLVLAFVFLMSFIYAIWFQRKVDGAISENLVRTIGKVTKISSTRYSKKILFTYYIEGKEFNGSDFYSGNNAPRIRLSRPILGQFYWVEYEKENPENHRIIIGKKPLNPLEFIDDYFIVEGCVQKQMNLQPYIDLYIDYEVKNKSYSFRTRMHQDSIQLYTSKKCKKKMTISFDVSKEYPFINKLFYLSRDRQYKGSYSTEGKWDY